MASKSTTTARHNAANKILKNMCEHSNTLVQQAMMVSAQCSIQCVMLDGCMSVIITQNDYSLVILFKYHLFGVFATGRSYCISVIFRECFHFKITHTLSFCVSL